MDKLLNEDAVNFFGEICYKCVHTKSLLIAALLHLASIVEHLLYFRVVEVFIEKSVALGQTHGFHLVDCSVSLVRADLLHETTVQHTLVFAGFLDLLLNLDLLESLLEVFSVRGGH